MAEPNKSEGAAGRAGRSARKPRETKGSAPEKVEKTAFERLRGRQKLFVLGYLKHFCGAKAYKEAGYRDKAARECASRLLTNANVSAAISEELEKRGITPERTLIRVATVAYTGDLANFQAFLDGRRDLEQLREEGVDTSLVKRAREIRREQMRDGEVIGVEVRREIELYSMLDALLALLRVHGRMTERREVKITGDIPAAPDFENMTTEEVQRYARAVGQMDDMVSRAIAEEEAAGE